MHPRPTPISTLDVAGLIRAIRHYGEMHDSYDTFQADKAIDAFQHGRPVFWSTARYHNQTACCLHSEANRIGLAATLAEHPDFAEWLDTLIALTPSAKAALEEARWQVAGMRVAAE